jgi:hypothetical protein
MQQGTARKLATAFCGLRVVTPRGHRARPHALPPADSSQQRWLRSKHLHCTSACQKYWLVGKHESTGWLACGVMSSMQLGATLCRGQLPQAAVLHFCACWREPSEHSRLEDGVQSGPWHLLASVHGCGLKPTQCSTSLHMQLNPPPCAVFLPLSSALA